jgi:hypothetical protein
VAILGGLAAWWAAIAAGPVIPLFASGEEVSIDNSRVLRIGQANLASGFWFIMMLVEYPGNFTLPLGLTVAAAMCAGGVTRSVQVRAFSNYLTSTQQHVYCAALLVLAILLAFLAVSFGNRVEWQVPLFVAVMTLVFLRRPIVGTYPFPSIDIRLIGFGAFAAYQVFRIFTPGAVESSFEQASAKTFFIGALFMLTGIVITTIHWLVSSLNQDRAVR